MENSISPKEGKIIDQAVIRFAGDSGDGIQLIGSEFTNATAISQNDLGTFPDFPAEIRAPVGTLAGVSGFQIQFGSHEIYTPGDNCDTLVVMNAAALKKNLSTLKSGGIIIANEEGFDAKNLRLAGIEAGDNPLKNGSLDNYELHTVNVSKITREAVSGLGLGTKEADRCKNMFVLGLLYWLYDRPIIPTENFIQKKFAKNADIASANIRALYAGYNYGETAEAFNGRFEIKPASIPPGVYRNITGNIALAYGLIAAADKAGLQLFYGTYPITPASDILHELSKHKNFNVLTFQAEDEIAAISSAIGASYGGALGVTGSSGPGIDLKTEAMGLAMMLELPLVIVNVQRAGPSTGMPTKTEQADLLQAFFGRHGESPIPIVAAQSPSDCFFAAYEAAKAALEFMTPVILLSDGFIANGSEPWKFPQSAELSDITLRNNVGSRDMINGKYYPYQRDERLVRKWALPGKAGFQNRIGGIEKEDVTGNISYDALNHQHMTNIRKQKVENIAAFIGEIQLDNGKSEGDILLLSWGGTYGTVKTAVIELINEGIEVSHLHLRWINPFPSNLRDILSSFSKIIIPEINMGQLALLIKAQFRSDAIQLNKVQGLPFTVKEITDFVRLIES